MKAYFTPGPSQLYHTYESHLRAAMKAQVGSISHRSVEFQNIYSETASNLKQLLRLPEDYSVFFLSSATDIWERIIQNLVENRSHHFVNGAFSKRFYDFALKMGKSPTQIIGNGVEEFESFDVPKESELIAVTMNETSRGFSFDTEKLKLLRAHHPEKLIALDIVSATPAIDIDFSLVDTAYFSIQKCFGMPAGLGVWLINNRSIEKALTLEKSGDVSPYRSISSIQKYALKHQTPETPNAMAIYILGKIAEDMMNRGLKIIQNETVYKSTILYQTLANHPLLAPSVSGKNNRSKTVVVANCEDHQAKILDYFKRLGMILGKGYGEQKDSQIRIANFPAHSKEQIELLCDHLDKLS